MLLLLGNDLPNHLGGCRIARVQHSKLMLEVRQDDAFDRLGRQRNCARAQQAGYRTQKKSAQFAQVETPAPADAAMIELRRKQRAVPLLMSHEMRDLSHHAWSPPARKPSLRAIDAHGPMLPGVVNL